MNEKDAIKHEQEIENAKIVDTLEKRCYVFWVISDEIGDTLYKINNEEEFKALLNVYKFDVHDSKFTGEGWYFSHTYEDFYNGDIKYLEKFNFDNDIIDGLMNDMNEFRELIDDMRE